MGIFSAIFGGNALKKAAKRNIAEAKAAQADSLGYFNPFTQNTAQDVQYMRDATGIGNTQAAIDRFQASPEYKLNYDTAIKHGTEGVNAMAQAGGSYDSGRTLKALQDRAQETSRGFFGDYLKGLGGFYNTDFNAAGKQAGIRGEGSQNIQRGNSDYADAKVSQYQGYDDLLGGFIKTAAGMPSFGSTKNPLY